MRTTEAGYASIGALILALTWSLAWVAGCAHATGSSTAAPVVTPRESAEGEGASPHQHGAHGARGVPVTLPHHVIDGGSGQRVDAAGLERKLKAARVIYVGEEHSSPHDHAAELEILEAAYAADPSLGLGLEMLPRSAQPAIDRYLAGAIDEPTFLAEVGWEKAWGYPFGFYRGLFDFSRAHHLPIYALNAPRDLVHVVAKDGIEKLSPAERALVPELSPGPAAHRELVRQAFGGHPHGRFSDGAFERFYTAQLIWDETMADKVASVLTQPGGPRHLLVVAGEGHVRRFAVPGRAARRGATSYVTVLPVLEDDAEEARTDGVADLLWVLGAP
jgi:uncharacterized iron-regulated protein